MIRRRCGRVIRGREPAAVTAASVVGATAAAVAVRCCRWRPRRSWRWRCSRWRPRRRGRCCRRCRRRRARPRAVDRRRSGFAQAEARAGLHPKQQRELGTGAGWPRRRTDHPHDGGRGSDHGCLGPGPHVDDGSRVAPGRQATGESQSYWKKTNLVTRNRGRGQVPMIREYSVNKKGQLVVWTQFQGVSRPGDLRLQAGLRPQARRLTPSPAPARQFEPVGMSLKARSRSTRISPGRVSTRSAMMLRRISSVPAAIRMPGAAR